MRHIHRFGVGQWRRKLVPALIVFLWAVSARTRELDAPQAREKTSKQIVAALELGKSETRELNGGAAEAFTISLKKGQFLRVVAEQQGIDVVLSIIDPSGKELVAADSPNEAWGPEPASVIAAESGAYAVEVKSTDKNAAAGKYRITVTDLRETKPEDQTRIEAERTLFEAVQVGEQRESDSRKKAAALYQKAASLWRVVRDPYEEAMCLKQAGNLTDDDPKEAIEYYRQALELYREMGDHQEETAVLRAIGVAYFVVSDYRKALAFFEQALPLLRELKDSKGEAEALIGIGGADIYLGENEEALEFLGQALSLARSTNDRGNESEALTEIGGVYANRGENQKALEYYRQALPLRREVGDREGEANTLRNLGSAYADLGEKRKALEFFEQALSLERSANHPSGEAGTLANMGSAYVDLGENQKALEVLNQALPLARGVGDRNSEARSLALLGMVYSNLGEKEKGLQYDKQASALYRTAGNREGEARVVANMGIVYAELGDNQKALASFNEALPLYRATNNRFGEAHVLGIIGAQYIHQDEKQKAAQYLNQALPLLRAVSDPQGEAYVLNYLGFIHFELGEKQQALECYTQALQLFRGLSERRGEAVTLIDVGIFELDAGEKQKALDAYNDALFLFRSVQDPQGEGNALDALMLYWKKTENAQLAIFFGKQAVNTVQQVRRNIQGLEQGLQKSFLESKAKVYRDLGDLLISEGRLAEAQQVLDLLKEEEYFEFVRGEERSVEAKNRPVVLNPEEQSSHDAYEKIAGQITALGQEYAELRAKRERTAEEEAHLTELNEKLTLANQEMGRFFKTLYVEFGKNTQANQMTQNVREESSAMQTLVRELGPGTVALYTLVGESRYRVIVITPSTMQAREYPIAAADLRKKVATFLEALKNPSSDPLPPSQELYKILIAPMAEDLKGAKAQTLMWSLNDVLRYVPMAALHDGKQYLVESYRNVVITPASIARLKDKGAASDSSIAGMGVSKDYDGLGPLPAVPGELRQIIHDETVQGARGVQPGTVLLDDDFTEKRMVSALDKHYPVVHIASHFVLQAGNETNSYLLLGGKDVGGKGYHLTLAELRDDPALTFDGTELLTLSACQTGTSGTALNGREVDGLGITAQQKGAKAVLASLWSVADESTAMLMADFYDEWLRAPGMTKAAALQAAQRKMLHGAVGVQPSSARREGSAEAQTTTKKTLAYSHPFFWAGFILIGNWN